MAPITPRVRLRPIDYVQNCTQNTDLARSLQIAHDVWKNMNVTILPFLTFLCDGYEMIRCYTLLGTFYHDVGAKEVGHLTFHKDRYVIYVFIRWALRYIRKKRYNVAQNTLCSVIMDNLFRFVDCVYVTSYPLLILRYVVVRWLRSLTFNVWKIRFMCDKYDDPALFAMCYYCYVERISTQHIIRKRGFVNVTHFPFTNDHMAETNIKGDI